MEGVYGSLQSFLDQSGDLVSSILGYFVQFMVAARDLVSRVFPLSQEKFGRRGGGGEGAWGGDTRKYSRTCMVTTTRERPPRISDCDFSSYLALRMEPFTNDHLLSDSDIYVLTSYNQSPDTRSLK